MNHELTQRPRLVAPARQERPFTRLNFIMMAMCIGLIVLGFVLMSGAGSTAETGFNPDIFSTRRIVVGPAISFLGFLLMAFAIIWQPRSKDNKEDNQRQTGEENGVD